MITQITKKELRRIKSLRKVSASQHSGMLVWIAPNGKAYKCDKSGMAGVKEMTDWNKKIEADLTAQTELI